MAFLFKLETTDGVPAEPPTLSKPTGAPATRDGKDASPVKRGRASDMRPLRPRRACQVAADLPCRGSTNTTADAFSNR
jgi:hypothetical protein